jgi:hypothetical protein
MNAGAPSDSTSSVRASPVIYEATRATDESDAVIRGAELTQAQAMARRQAGNDIVVCGPDTPQNDRLAHDIEDAAAAGGSIIYHGPHGGPLSLPHWQQKVPPPGGHSFHETHVRKARTMS